MIKPSHYAIMKIDVRDFVMANQLDFCQGNIIKYVCRYKKKDGIKDLEKARDYLNYLIEKEKEKEEEDDWPG